MKDVKRGERHSHLKRMKAKARRLLIHNREPEKLANHMANCSCHMCGNPRKHWNEKTMQEKKFESSPIDD